MEPQISEFSYGYAVVEELTKRYKKSISSAPFFPSLRKKKKKGGGYDVRIERGKKGLPLFIQFKLSHVFVRNTAKEVNLGYLSTPFNRFYIIPKSKSKQHNMLVDLYDKKLNEVYYISPYFNTQEELNYHYLDDSVLKSSFQVNPKIIGKINDNKKHHISFKKDSKHFYIFSEPMEKEGNFGHKKFYKEINNSLESIEDDLPTLIKNNNEHLLSTISKNYPMMMREIVKNIPEQENEIMKLFYLSRYFLGAEVILLTNQ